MIAHKCSICRQTSFYNTDTISDIKLARIVIELQEKLREIMLNEGQPEEKRRVSLSLLGLMKSSLREEVQKEKLDESYETLVKSNAIARGEKSIEIIVLSILK